VGVQERNKHISVRGPRVDGQSGGCVDAYPHRLGVAHLKVQDPIVEGCVQGPELGDELGGDYGVEC
jgi:hypothetical protein